MQKSKKLTILYVLKILEEYSSIDRPITQEMIKNTINIAGINCDRKMIGRDINSLISYGYDIVKIKGGGCYLNSNKVKFTVNEYRKISSCVKVSSLDSEEKIKLCKKLKELINVIE